MSANSQRKQTNTKDDKMREVYTVNYALTFKKESNDPCSMYSVTIICGLPAQQEIGANNLF